MSDVLNASGQDAAAAFGDVLHDELDEIGRSRQGLPATDPEKVPGDVSRWPQRQGLADVHLPVVRKREDETDHYRRASASELLGLAFSGGGIRSATFNLGIVQGLARYGLLPRFDYLSVVSGGSYIGSWLTAFIKRKGLRNVCDALACSNPTPKNPEVPEISFLRQYSNYLTPKLGLFSADTLTAVSIYVRNLALNLVILLAALSAVLLLPRLARYLTNKVWPLAASGSWSETLLPWISLGCFAIATLLISLNVFSEKAWKRDPNTQAPPWYTTQPAIQWLVVIPGFVFAWCVAPLLLQGPAWSWVPFREIRYWTIEDRTVWGLPFVVTLFSIVAVGMIGLAGRRLDSQRREWFSRLGAWNLTYALGWLAVCSLALYSAQYWTLTQDLARSQDVGEYLKSKELWKTLIGLLIGGGASGVVAGSGDKQGSVDEPQRTSPWIAIAPYAFILGLSMALAIFLDLFLTETLAFAAVPETGSEALKIVFLCGILLVFAFLVSSRVDINEFSMHNFYRNRLVRCYIGASDAERLPHAFTGFDPREHYLRVSDLTTNQPQLEGRPRDVALKILYFGPYYIVNTALNLAGGDNLAWQQRKAASFSITPLYSGYQTDKPSKRNLAKHAYRPTVGYDHGMSIGTAMATSGAAASPNMGYHSTKPLAFLMTILNVRLGRWMGNARHNKTWSKAGPYFGLASLLSELFGLSDDESRFVYLSDGGHFENLGIYELVRRRCRYIVACDAGQDGGQKFEDLGNAIEKCRTDLGIDIQMNVDPIRFPAGSKMSETHCAVGVIRYDCVHDDLPQGTLVYIKTSLTGDEPTDVLRYAAQDPAFPHQSTGDQFFGESQFESYRELGEHIAKEVLNGAGDEKQIRQMETHDVFLKLKHYWYPSSLRIESHFTKHAAQADRIYSELRGSKNLAFLSHQIYPEWRKLVLGKAECERKDGFWLPESCDEIREGFYLCNQVIQLMESVYLDLALDQEHDHPDNRGWMNFFKHWSWSGMFRVTWAISIGTYGARFQTFCERHLDLDLGQVVIGDAQKASVLSPPDWEELENRLLLNFLEIKLLKGLIQMDRQREMLKTDESSFTVYPLGVEVSVPSRPDSERFYFGVALTYGETLRCFRVQDHIRKMGLGRKGLTKLLMREDIGITGLDLSRYPGDELDDESEADRATRLAVLRETEFPSTKGRGVLEALFHSVKAQLDQARASQG